MINASNKTRYKLLSDSDTFGYDSVVFLHKIYARCESNNHILS